MPVGMEVNMSDGFDFEGHRIRAWEAYGAIRPKYERFSNAVESIIRKALQDIEVHQVAARAKSIEKFAKKASKPDPDDPTRPKYSDPLQQIEDLAGARVIAYVLRSLERIEGAISREFEVLERSDKLDKLMEKGAVGYRSIHLVARMRSERTSLLEYKEFDGLKVEIQIRTILQHAWAEIEHDMRYKPSAEPNKELNQRFTALAGLIEIGDREFDQIYEIYEIRKKALVELSQLSDPESGGLSSKVVGNARDDEDDISRFAISIDGDAVNQVQPRELLASRKYSEAIVRYSELISEHPNQFSNYLGRAKAKFLLGDVAGAHADIIRAEELSPDHPFIAQVRALIEDGGLQEKDSDAMRLALREGHTALRDGQIDLALEKYDEAERYGFSPVMSLFNKAMAKFAKRDFAGVFELLDKLNPLAGSILEFHVATLGLMSHVMRSPEDSAAAVKLISERFAKIKARYGYQYGARSPLSDLEIAVSKEFTAEEAGRLALIFSVLKGGEGDVKTPVA